MPLYKTFRDESVIWGIWKAEESLEVLYNILPIPEMYKADIDQLKSVHRQQERLAVRVLLYTLLGEEREILYYSSGRPYFADHSYCISISHTKGYVAVILGRGAVVGIDIEHYGERARNVSHKFMREDEIPAVYMQTDIWSLLLHWSAKETLYKCIDCEGVDFREHLRVYPFCLQSEGNFLAQEFRREDRQKYIIRYLIDSEFVMTWTESALIGKESV